MEVSEAYRALSSAAEKAGQVAVNLSSSLDSASFSDGVSLLTLRSATVLRHTLNLLEHARARVKGDAERARSLAPCLARDAAAHERARGLTKRLRPVIDDALRQAEVHGDDADAGRVHKPRPGDFVIGDEEEEASGNDARDGGETGVYKAPRLAAVAPEGDDDAKARREAKRKERERERARRGAGVREMLAELRGAPEEIDDGGGVEGAARRRLEREERKRRNYEEENFVRVGLSKSEKKERRRMQRDVLMEDLEAQDALKDLAGVAERVVKGAKRKNEREKEEDEIKVKALEAMDRADGLASGDGFDAPRKRRRRRK